MSSKTGHPWRWPGRDDSRNCKKWWIPEPMTCRVIRMDLRAGGGFETQMGDNGKDFPPHLDAGRSPAASPGRADNALRSGSLKAPVILFEALPLLSDQQSPGTTPSR